MQAKMLDGKVAIVSGASYGMGYSMAELFAREGAKVVMTARGQEKHQKTVDMFFCPIERTGIRNGYQSYFLVPRRDLLFIDFSSKSK